LKLPKSAAQWIINCDYDDVVADDYGDFNAQVTTLVRFECDDNDGYGDHAVGTTTT